MSDGAGTTAVGGHTAENDAPRPGWQQPAIPRLRSGRSCPHLGLMFAQLAAHQHSEGHEWVCGCGATFMVVSNVGRDKRLVPKPANWGSRVIPPAKGADRIEAAQ